jgi:hypothetical protein
MTSAQTQQTLPTTPHQAQAEREFWEARLLLAQVKFMVAKRQMEQAQDDLDTVKQIAAGAFEPDEPKSNGYVMSSFGPWCLGDQR